MFRKPTLMSTAAVALAAGIAAMPAYAETFRWSGQTDPSTLDPHAANLAPVHSYLNNLYEGMVRRGRDMTLEPALAERWEALGEDGWRFHIRQGVTFHEGQELTADDVLFSFERASSEQSDVRSFFASIEEVRVVDDYTVDFLTRNPDPLFPSGIANFMIMDRGWAEANGATEPSRDTENHATFNANGTGAFRVVERQPDVRTVLHPFDEWWEEAAHGITEAVWTPIPSAATRIAALLSGEADFVEPVPLQDIDRIAGSDGFTVHSGVEARVIFLGFEHADDSLRFSDLDGVNPFRDGRVREAVNRAINADAIVQTIMRGNAERAGLLISPAINGYRAALDRPYAYDPDGARALLAEAGYPDGFSFALRCPNDRYINDEAICTAVVGMLAQVGLDVDLIAEPVSGYWQNLRDDQFDMYMLGWSPGTFDAEHPIRFLMATPNPELRLGSWNFGEYSNPRVDELLPRIQRELDAERRQAMIDEVHTILHDEAVYVPLHVQPLVWASREDIAVTQRADNFFILRWVRFN